MAAYFRIAQLPVVIALLLVFSIAVACGGSAPAEPAEKPMAKEAEKAGGRSNRRNEGAS